VLQWPYLDVLPINTGTGGSYDIPTQSLQLKIATLSSIQHTNDSKTTAFGYFIGLKGRSVNNQTPNSDQRAKDSKRTLHASDSRLNPNPGVSAGILLIENQL